jgi:hypothetical protein
LLLAASTDQERGCHDQFDQVRRLLLGGGWTGEIEE